MEKRLRMNTSKFIITIWFVTGIFLGFGSSFGHDFTGPSFTVEPPNKVEFTNISGTWIECTAYGDPPPSIHWISADGSILDDTPERKVLKNGTLVMLPFSAAAYRQDIHDTVYRCVASNAVGAIVSRDVKIRAVVVQDYKVSVEVISAPRGCTAVLRCIIPSFVKDYVKVVSWVQDPATHLYPKLEGDGKYHVLPSGQLLIYDLQLSDQYPQYRCRTMHRLTRQVVGSPPVSIQINESRRFHHESTMIEHSGTVYVEYGETAIMWCIPPGCSSSYHRWFKGSEALSLNPRTQTLGVILALEAVTPEDAGIYRCSALNEGGEVTADVRLVVTSPLFVELITHRSSVDLGETADFLCNVDYEEEYGRPFTISWYKDGKPLPGSGRDNTNHYVIRGVTRDNIGMYQCIVRREGESEQSSTQLHLGDSVPVVLYHFIEQTVQPGPDISMKCRVNGNPTPQIKWLLDGFPLPNNSRFQIGQYVTITGEVIGHLNITQVAVEDGGEYTCMAENRLGVASHMANLNVYGLPYIRPMPKVTAIAGNSLKMKCPVAGYPIKEIHWEQGGKILPTDIRQKVGPDGTLTISTIQKENDAGIYTCFAKNDEGKSARRSVEIAVIVPPKLSTSPDRTLNVGERASLTCSVIKGDLPISMEWLKDGRTVDAQSVTITQLDQYNSILLIESLSQEHHGNYSCYAKNAAAEVSYTTQLFVNAPPIIEPFSFQDGLSEGMRTRTVCGVSQGDPPLTITWLKDDENFPPHLGANYTTLDAYSSLLSIPSLTSSHSGAYTCVASNPAALVRYTAKLLVKVPPKWKIEPSNMVNVVRNERVMFHCQAEGVPSPKIVWKKPSVSKDGEYEEISESWNTKIFANGSLLLQQVKEDSQGVYMCQANNGIGNPIGRMVQLKVNSPPYFSSYPQRVTAKKGETAVLQCSVNGDKPITISWFKDGTIELTPNGNYRISVKPEVTSEGATSEIKIAGVSVSDSGTYVCQASNVYGQEHQVIQLLVQEPPPSPWDLKTVSLSTKAVEVSWKEPPKENREDTEYLVQYKVNDESDNWRTIRAGNTLSARIDDLVGETSYAIRVIAKDDAGQSPPSLPLVIKTPSDKPDGPPLHVNVRPISSTQIFVSWFPPLPRHRNGKIVGCSVGVQEASIKDLYYLYTEVDGDVEEGGEFVISGLNKFTRYAIVVACYTRVGVGPNSDPVVTQTLEDVPNMSPDDVRCVALSPQSLQISWQPPPTPHCNGVLQGYKVHIEPLNDDVQYDTDDIEPKKTTSATIVISGLKKFTNYSVRVLAFTRIGDGPLTKPTYCQTDEDVPGSPADVKVLVKTSNSLLVSWLPPKEPNGVIIKYNLYMRTNNPSRLDLRQNQHYLSPQQTSYEVKNLPLQIEYKFHVTASTKIGEGQNSKTVSQFLSSRIPARVASFGGLTTFPWKTSATLPCNAVGEPNPIREWYKGNQPLKPGAGRNYKILESGEIVFSHLEQSDTGNYTCKVDNTQGSDRIIYNLIVQVPPSTPFLSVTSTTSNSILFHWTPGSSGGAVSSFILHYSKSTSDSEELILPRRTNSYELKNLTCGSTYHLFMIAQNKIGLSPQSPTLSVSTQGGVPGVPQGSTLIQPNSTSVLLRLHTWPDGGCPLLYFVIEYRSSLWDKWTQTDNTNIKPQKKFTIIELQPATVYYLRIKAHNEAGSSMGEFTFITLTENGDPPPPELITKSRSTHSSNYFLTDPKLMVPSLFAIATLCAALVALAICWRKKQVRPLKESLDNDQNMVAQRERYYGTLHKVVLQENKDKIPETAEDITPYATFQLSQMNPPTNAMLHSFLYHEEPLRQSYAPPPHSGMKTTGERRARSRSSKRETESGESDSETEESSRTESANKLNGYRLKQNYLYRGPYSSPMSEAKSLPRRGRSRSNNRRSVSSKSSLRSLLPPLATAETNFNGLPLERLPSEGTQLSESECDMVPPKKIKLSLMSSPRSRPTGRTNQTDYSIAV